MIKGSIQEEDIGDITIVKNICTQHKTTSMYNANANIHKKKIQQ